MSAEVSVDYLSDTCVRLECSLAAPPDRVYRAWTTGSEISRWFTCEPGAVVEAELDPRVGGAFRLDIIKSGVRNSVLGEYTVLEPGRRIGFTWHGGCSGGADPVSEVMVELAVDGAGTRLVLTHDRLEDLESRRRHEAGWRGCLDGLTHFSEAM